jgi:hypothetical protein
VNAPSPTLPPARRRASIASPTGSSPDVIGSPVDDAPDLLLGEAVLLGELL